MNDDQLLQAYDDQVRRHQGHEAGTTGIEHEDGVVRVVAPGDGWRGVTFTELDEATAGAAIAAQIERFARLSAPWEWKHYSYDRPADLPDRLRGAGFVSEPPEALLLARIEDLDLVAAPPAGVRIVPVTDRQGIDALVHVHNEVFGGDHSAIGKALAVQLQQRPVAVAAVLAVADGIPISSARAEFTHGTDFASLWGGGTLPQWRGRGVYRSLVAYRAALAAAAGFHYLHVDASDASRPILQRLGFSHLATTTPFKHPGTPA